MKGQKLHMKGIFFGNCSNGKVARVFTSEIYYWPQRFISHFLNLYVSIHSDTYISLTPLSIKGSLQRYKYPNE